MARSIVSFGMLPALASEIALRRRAFASGSPPPVRAATVSSLMNLVKSFPRLASSAPFLCLIECHFECPDIGLVPLYQVRLSAGKIREKVVANIARPFGSRKLNMRLMKTVSHRRSPQNTAGRRENLMLSLCSAAPVAVHPPVVRGKGRLTSSRAPLHHSAMTKTPYEKTFERALNLLSYKPRSLAEMRARLMEKDWAEEAVVNQVLA